MALSIFPISPLIRSGVFKREAADPASPGIDPEWTMEVQGSLWSFEYSPENSCLTVRREKPDALEAIEVALEFSQTGRRCYFVCDCCCQLRDRLVVDQDQLVCFRYYADHGAVGHKALRNAELTIASHTLKVRNDIARRRFQAEIVKTDKPASSAIASWSDRPSNWHTSEGAHDRGRGMGQSNIYQKVSESPPDQWQCFDPQESYRQPERTGLIGQFPELDLRYLAARMFQYPGRLVAQTFLWGEKCGVHEEVLLLVDWRGDDPQVIAGHDYNSGKIRWQPIEVFKHNNGRYSFICPVLKKTCFVLFLRGGSFASAKAQRLYNPSQRESKNRGRTISGHPQNG